MGGNVAITTFAGGEIGKEALARVELDLYPSTCEVMENFFPGMRGSMIKVPGTDYVGQLLASTAILRPFAFNVDQTRVLEISDSELRIVDGDEYVSLVGGEATLGTPVNNASTGGSSIDEDVGNVTFTATAGGEARVTIPVTDGELVQTSFQFEIQRRPLRVSVGTTASLSDIAAEILLEPGLHVITVLPTATEYNINFKLEEEGKAKLIGLVRKAPGRLVIETSWLQADLPGIRYRQSNDVVFMYHRGHRTRVLERLGDTSWSLRYFRPKNGPFEAPNLTRTTLTPSGTSGSVNITASKAIFAASSVGQLLELEHQGQTETLDATAVDQASQPIRVFGLENNRLFNVKVEGTFVGTVKLQRSFGNTVDWTDYLAYTAPTTTTVDDALDNQTIYYRFLCSGYTSGTIECTLTYGGGTTTGRGEIVEFTSPTSVVVEVYENFGSLNATTRWSEGSWSTLYDWPVAGLIEDARHWLTGDGRLFVSESDDYESYELSSDPSGAIQRTIGVGDTNVSRWIEMATRIVVGTHGGELEVGSNNLDETVTYQNIKARPAGDEGSADTQAMKAGNRIVYIDQARTRLLQAYLDSETGKTEIDDLCRLHEKMAGEVEQDSDDGFVELAYQRKPEKRIWVVRSDGQVSIMLYIPREGHYGWARIKMANGGKVKSLCIVPGKPEDRVHVLVEREINGETVLYHERFALNRFPVVVTTNEDGTTSRSAPKAHRLQCALVSSGDPETVFGNLDHLEGETVAVWGDGKDMGQYVVEGGQITLSIACSYVIIGLAYDAFWKSSKLAYGSKRGSALTQQKTVGRLGVVTHETPLGVLRWGRDFDSCNDKLVNEFFDGIIMDQPALLVSSDENQPFEGITDIDARICLKASGPAPVTVLAIVPNIDLEEWA